MNRSSLVPLLATLLFVLPSCADENAGDVELVETEVAEEAADPGADAVTAGTLLDPNDVDGEVREGELLDPNKATREQLVAAGLDEAGADALVAGRPYADMLAVNRTLGEAGLDAAAREQAYARVWLPLDLNAASEEEILLIPGVGDRMAHEFEEYRPYRAIEQFRREIGKYVDEAEVARLERYVELR